MKPQTVLSKASDILKYLRTRRKRRLYQQWVERAGLPPEAVRQEEVAEHVVPEIDKWERRQPLMYMLLGACILILLVGLILLIVHAC